ncbi:HAD hydrolase-like protein [Roseomonas stagni]|uniref:HAD hydrolase-like protein n=1 Tax=Falsiroseomonas algicola TaxID=2716930 RepID=A0A6M1LPQ9_9PROT|nr:HAD hydrolase-like protein [Falsiroseomonas algicola]NGM21979.1 HAD hydrolase-like protein [Falsiroseomonas algicola]
MPRRWHRLPATPRLLILDFDGTLVDSRPWFLLALDDAARRFGFRRITAEEAEALRGLPTRAILRALRVPPWQVPMIALHLRRLAAQAPPPPLFPGVPDLLARLRAHGVTLGLVTSNAEATARRALGASAATITHWSCDASLFGKAARFRTMLRRASVAPRDAAAIGDEIRDIEAARRAGLRVAAVTWGYATAEALAAARPDALIDTMDDLADWIGLDPATPTRG